LRVVDTTVLLVSVGVVTDAVVVVGVTIVELVSVGETSRVPVAAIGAVADVPVMVVVVSSVAGAVATVSVPLVSVFSTSSRLHAMQRVTQRTARIRLRMEQLSFVGSVRQKMGRADFLSVVLIAFAALRIIATLTVFSATTDEGLHVSSGLQLVQEGKYAFQIENPPLPRLVFAWPLHLIGGTFRSDVHPMFQMGTLFFTTGHYKTALFAARIGNVLFFILAALATWRLARRELGPAGGALATLLFTTQPIVLGMAGIANLDMATVTGVAVALLAFSRWLEKPTAKRAFITGLAYGLSIGLKFSNLLFTAAACLALYLVHFAYDANVRRAWRRALAALPIVIVATFLGIWACYGFTVTSYEKAEIYRPDPREHAFARMLAGLDPSTPVPMLHFWSGVSGIFSLDRSGIHMSYAFGRKTTDGWWWYFPAALLFKTTLATLLLALGGAFVARGRPWTGGIAATIAILIPAMPAKLDLGLRYVLPLYVPLSIAAAAAALAMLRRGGALRIAAIVLLMWQCTASLLTHPDYFPYFNELAGREPGRLFIDSNLDWGQDMLRLRNVLRNEKVPRLGRSIAGLHDFDRLGFPPSYEIEPWVASRGWIAVSEHMFRMHEKDGGYWYRRVGRSIRLYHYDP
jgi:4-amino-4-deoxy-L-arabinose transferase-like glycosyltransferase